MRKRIPVVSHTQLERIALIVLGFMAPWAVLGNEAPAIATDEEATFHSAILREDRAILVALPSSYGSGTDRYPVLYLTDAQWNLE